MSVTVPNAAFRNQLALLPVMYTCNVGAMIASGLLWIHRYEEVHIGEPAELLLLSNTPDFSSFKVGFCVMHTRRCPSSQTHNWPKTLPVTLARLDY